jgi:hypothetical protein
MEVWSLLFCLMKYIFKPSGVMVVLRLIQQPWVKKKTCLLDSAME